MQSIKFVRGELDKENLQKLRKEKAREAKIFLKGDGTIVFLMKQERGEVESLDLLELCDIL